jgi:hemerythrin-like domain-containing protein
VVEFGKEALSMISEIRLARRGLLHGAALLGTGLLVSGCSKNEGGSKAGGETAEEVGPGEDLMREHGVLKRVILIYRDILARLEARQDFPPDVLAGSAKLIRNFVEDYHEKLEEDYLFPRFKKANRLTDLVDVLAAQHQKGRILTDTITRLATPAMLKDTEQRRSLGDAMRQFIRMYEPHEAREDTVLFPEFHKIVSQHEYDALGDEFEKKENQLFGGDGFEKNVDAVAGLEKTLGIYDLAQFTPNV